MKLDEARKQKEIHDKKEREKQKYYEDIKKDFVATRLPQIHENTKV